MDEFSLLEEFTMYSSAKYGSLWHGHLFRFDTPRAVTFPPRATYRLLAIFVLLELIVRPVVRAAAKEFGISTHIWWQLAQMSLLTGLACLLVTRVARTPLSDLGLYPWRRWSRTERIFFPQIILLTLAVFSFVTAAELKALWTRSGWWQIVMFVFVPQMIWGFYQEFLYRGILQTVLVQRWGAYAGILVSNLIFTFGPLHFYHFAAAQKDPSHLWIFAGIFSIGLYFAMVFRRSGNLWIIAITHGLGDCFLDGLAAAAQMAR